MTRPLHIVIPGGSGQVGTMLSRHLNAQGHHVTVLTRHKHTAPWQVIVWDGTSLGDWAATLDGADVLINLSGRSVNCRYSEKNRAQIKESRTATTHLLGCALRQVANPPRLWMNASTATIYRHALDRPMDESGEIGGEERDVPSAWRFSIDVATSWEQIFFAASTPNLRKIALRSAMIMSPDRGGVFEQLLRLARFGLGGAAGSGQQFVSWIHDSDFLRSIDYLIAHDELDGPINLASPNPIPNREFMQVLRRTAGAATGLPSTRFMLEVGAWFLRTETELILKSRRVIPGRLLRPGSTSTFLTGRALQEIWSFAIAEGGANERSRDDDDNPFALEPLFFASTLAASGHVPSQGVHANCRWLSWAGGCSIGTPRDAQSNNGARLTRGQ